MFEYLLTKLWMVYLKITIHRLDERWTVRSTEWQIKGERSVERPKLRWRDNTVGQQGAVWRSIAKDRERWRTLAEGYFMQWKDTA